MKQVQQVKLVNKIEEDGTAKKFYPYTKVQKLKLINPQIYGPKILQFNSTQFPPWVKFPICWHLKGYSLKYVLSTLLATFFQNTCYDTYSCFFWWLLSYIRVIPYESTEKNMIFFSWLRKGNFFDNLVIKTFFFNKILFIFDHF